MLRERLTLTTADSLRLEAELVTPETPRAGAVLTHPHPRHGGNMRSMVPGELVRTLPDMGVATLRFNFRGMGASEGRFENGAGERLDIVAAVGELHDVIEGLPLIVCGSSFGADTALTVDDPRITAWCACAPPLRDARLDEMTAVGLDPRHKRLIVAERDQFRDPSGVADVTGAWSNTEVVVIPGADHFFIGQIELVVDAVVDLFENLG